jgi:putative endonuclease
MYFVYVIQSGDGRMYTGQTNNLARRLEEHEAHHGGRYTKRASQYKLIYSESFKTRGEAMMREKGLKSGQGRQWLKNKLSSKN